MKNRKKQIIILVLSTVIALACGVILLLITRFTRQSEKNTQLFNATVDRVELVEGKEIYIEILPKEYNTFLLVTVTSIKELNAYKISNLQKNQQISFRVSKTWLQDGTFNCITILPITSLSAEGEEIFSLEDYNAFAQKENLPIEIMCVVLIIISILYQIIEIIKLVKRRQMKS